MSAELLAGLIMASLLIALAIGIPVAFALSGVGLIFITILRGDTGLNLIVTAIWHMISSEVMLATPLFVLMAGMLEFSGIGAGLFEAAYKWFSGIRGGVAVATIAACTILAAITGLGATGVVVMGTLALPEMYKRGYAKSLALGCIPAGGALGPIIPPSVPMIIMAMMAEQSVGKVFMGALIPGLLMSAMFCLYIIVRCAIQPSYGPGVPKQERASWKQKFILLRGLIAPIVLILAVLGTIYGGIATVTEAAGIGAAGALLVSAIYRELTWSNLKQALMRSLLLTCLIMWIAIGGTLFAGVLTASGASIAIQGAIGGLPLGATGLLILMLVVALILGLFIDTLAIIMITVPIFVPLAEGVHIDPVYFVVIYSISIIIGLITPPFGINLFYLKGIAPDEKIGDVYRASIPFAIIMTIALFLCVAYPQIVMWLPGR